jgi:hypothetical protein
MVRDALIETRGSIFDSKHSGDVACGEITARSLLIIAFKTRFGQLNVRWPAEEEKILTRKSISRDSASNISFKQIIRRFVWLNTGFQKLKHVLCPLFYTSSALLFSSPLDP